MTLVSTHLTRALLVLGICGLALPQNVGFRICPCAGLRFTTLGGPCGSVDPAPRRSCCGRSAAPRERDQGLARPTEVCRCPAVVLPGEDAPRVAGVARSPAAPTPARVGWPVPVSNRPFEPARRLDAVAPLVRWSPLRI